MLHYYKVYAKVNCPFCVEAVNKMNEHGFDHALILLDKATDYYEALKKKLDHQTVPIIIKVSKIDGSQEKIGGFDDFQKFLYDKGYEKC